jgi:hypothetical protein
MFAPSGALSPANPFCLSLLAPAQLHNVLSCKPQVAQAMSTAETALASVKSLLSKVMTEAEGYPDLIRAYYSCETGQTDPLVQVGALLLRSASLASMRAALGQVERSLRAGSLHVCMY